VVRLLRCLHRRLLLFLLGLEGLHRDDVLRELLRPLEAEALVALRDEEPLLELALAWRCSRVTAGGGGASISACCRVDTLSKFIERQERPRRQEIASYVRAASCAVANVPSPMRSSPLRISA
jgi:hypothetical protein